jgi:hypothetical protein
MPVCNFWITIDNGDTAGHSYYGDRHSMAITIAVSS